MYSIGTIKHFCPVFTGQRPSKLGIKLGTQFKLGILASMNHRLYSEKVHYLYHALGSSHELYLVVVPVLWRVRTYRRS